MSEPVYETIGTITCSTCGTKAGSILRRADEPDAIYLVARRRVRIFSKNMTEETPPRLYDPVAGLQQAFVCSGRSCGDLMVGRELWEHLEQIKRATPAKKVRIYGEAVFGD